MEAKEKFEQIELNVLRVQGFPRDICSLFGKVHLEIRVGQQRQRTTSVRGMAPHVWDEKFAFDLAGAEDLCIGLWKTKPFGKPALLCSVTVPIGLEPRNQDRTQTFSCKRRPITVTYQLQEPGTNQRHSSALISAVPEQASTSPDGALHTVADDAAMMKVYVHTSENPPLAITDVSAIGETNFLVVDSIDSADIAIRRSGDDEILLSRLDGKLSRYELPDVRLSVSTTKLPSVLDAIAHFHYFLNKRPEHGQRSDGLVAHGEVRLEMYNLHGEYGARVPNMDLGNLVSAENEVRFRLDTQEKYGFAVCNYSERDLFPYLFYFDPASYSIDAWYLPEPTMAPPLIARPTSSTEPTRITVGYGASGGYAFQFVIPDGVTTDTGFLKLFVSTSYLDLTRIEQPAAVDFSHGEEKDIDSESPRRRLRLGDAEMWSALDVAVTMYTDDTPPRLQLS
ncbi:hypothetical protein C8R45DRAFT_106796 [Mycena sanguinolenta]|nr:hypothetical protein C8R45DRAFT_106796 [Mycena sanguinolenta]